MSDDSKETARHHRHDAGDEPVFDRWFILGMLIGVTIVQAGICLVGALIVAMCRMLT